jgi:hypothetical protein
VRINGKLLERKIRGFSVENGDKRVLKVCSADHATPLYPQKLALNF